MQSRILLKFNLLMLLSISFLPRFSFAEETALLSIHPETEIETTIHRADGNTLFIWLYSEAGPQKSEREIAKQIAIQNIEVWEVDLFSAHFLPTVSSSMDRIPDTDISQLISLAHKQTGKKIILVTSGRGTLPILKGAQLWQSKHPNDHALTGVILMSPKFYVETPDPGVEAKLLPIVEQTNLAIFILQPKKSPWYWKLDKTIPALEKNGSDVFVKRIKGVRGRYYFRPDADDYEKRLTKKLPHSLKQAANYLNALPYVNRKVVVASKKSYEIKTGKKERSLKRFQGNSIAPKLKLKNLHNELIDLEKLKGKVVLVNFWASWCPPCVHEMPSMNRLQKRFSAKGFTILGVNMAEDEKTVRHFINAKVSVQFPILFDSDGAALKDWGVFAFPTSYVIDKKGNIRYAIFGGVDWEKPSIVKKMHALINE